MVKQLWSQQLWKLIGKTIMATLEEIRNKLKAAETKRAEGFTNGDNTIYPQWNLKSDTKSVLRFLPDKDPDNTYFWVERLMINLPFTGVMGDAFAKPVVVRVPCMEMYGEQDPIIVETRPWWNDPSLKDMAAQYWKKRSYFFQGFVVEDGLKEENPPENPIRRFIITPQIFTNIKASLMDPDFEALPTDYVNGVDFKITKTKKGKYADYSTSEWARRSRPLSDDELTAIDTHGLFNLADFLPKKPNEVEQRVIREMFEASVNGEPYDPARWGQYYKPSDVQVDDSATDTTVVSKTPLKAVSTEKPSRPVPAPAPAVDEMDDDAPWHDEPKAAATGSASKAEDILAMIRNRKPA